MPALRYVVQEYTELWIPTAVTPFCAHLADVVRPLASTGIDLVGVGDLEMAEALRRKLGTFDSIVSWYGANRPEFRQALMSTGVQCVFHAALPSADYGGHATDFFLEQVGAPKGSTPQIELRAASRRATVVIHPFSGSARKNWPLSRYRELARQLRYPVEWTAGPDEDLPEAARFSNLHELAEWIAGAHLYIGNDSGITHLAAATGIRTLALFGPTSPRTWAPRGKNVHVMHSGTMAELDIDTVQRAANRLLDSR